MVILVVLAALVLTAATGNRRRSKRGDAGDDKFISQSLSPFVPDQPGPAHDEIIQSHLQYALYIAGLYKSADESDDATRAIAEHSLTVAVDGYLPGPGTDFLGYATPVILREVRARHLPATPRFRHLADALPASADRLARRTGRSPTIAQLAADMGASTEDIVESLDTALGYRATRHLAPGRPWGADHNAAEHESTDHEKPGDVPDFTTKLSGEQLKALLAPLSERNKRIVMMRYLRGMTDAQIGAELNISPVHVSRLLNRAVGAGHPAG